MFGRASLAGWLFPLVCLGTVAGVASSVSCDEDLLEETLSASVLSHRFTARREYCFLGDDGVTQRMTVRLESAGSGDQFGLHLESLDGRMRDELSDPEAFDALQADLDAGGGYRLLFQVGFSVHDVQLLNRSYGVFDVQNPAFNLLESAVHFLLAARRFDRCSWQVDLSVEPGREGFLLGYEKFRYQSGVRIVESSMRTLELDYGTCPVLPSPPASPLEGRESLDSVQELVDRAGFPLYYPEHIPAGFELIRVEVDTVRTSASLRRRIEPVPVYKLLFSDGVEVLYLFQTPPTALTSSIRQARRTSVPPLDLALVFTRDELSIREWSVPLVGSEIVIEGRSRQHVAALFRALREIE